VRSSHVKRRLCNAYRGLPNEWDGNRLSIVTWLQRAETSWKVHAR
jgi:hypothetical protein